jgi:hypothetical protein
MAAIGPSQDDGCSPQDLEPFLCQIPHHVLIPPELDEDTLWLPWNVLVPLHEVKRRQKGRGREVLKKDRRWGKLRLPRDMQSGGPGESS